VDAQANKLSKLTASDRNTPSARPWANTTGSVARVTRLRLRLVPTSRQRGEESD
jgi:hypothetical protein